MKEKLKEVVARVPKWARGVITCVVIVVCAVIVDYYLQNYIYKNKYEIVEDDYSHVFQIDSIEQKDNELVLTGWVFELEKDSVEDDFDIILYDYNNDIMYYMDTDDVVRKDVNEYFLCEYDYSNSGFVASLRLDKIDLKNTNYEVLIRPCNSQKKYKSSIYISKGGMMYAEPESFVALDVKGTELENIVDKGVLRLYRPDLLVYIYQYEGNLYWITEDGYEFNKDGGSTYIQFQLDTTQINRLPQERLENESFWDNISFYFERNEMTNHDTGIYRVSTEVLPTEYSISKIWTGYYLEDWKWISYFRPWYEFE